MRALTDPNYCADREAAEVGEFDNIADCINIDVAFKAMERYTAHGERIVHLPHGKIAVVVAFADPRIGTRRALEVWYMVDGYPTRSACQVSARDVSSVDKVRKLAAELLAS
jgi:hypothetical protein